MTSEPFDVVVVGSGAAGGMAAYALSKAGAKVCMVEAGRDYDPLSETPMWGLDSDAPLRAARTPDKPFGYYDATVGGGWDVPGEPYAADEGTEFRWYRARMLGGKTNHWGRVSLRLAEHDFKAASEDGLGVDWPFTYQELAPWYDNVERLVGITGRRNGLDDAPDSPEGILHEPPAPRAHERLIMRGGEKLGRPVVANHAAVLTRSINGRAACFYATPCPRGCSIGANFQSTTVLIPPALETGNLTIQTNAMVYEVSLGKDGRANGVHYVNTETGEHGFIAGKAVMLGASAMESVRILLNSKSSHYKNGIGADHGFLGRYIADTIGSSVWAQFPALENLPGYNDDGIWYPHVYVPWWGRKDKLAGKLDFPRGYHLEVSGGRREPGTATFKHLDDVAPSSFGAELKEDARRYYATFVRLTQRGEAIPREANTITLNTDIKDRYGIPTPVFRCEWSEHERKQTSHAQRSIRELIAAAGGRTLSDMPDDINKVMSKPGEIIHEVGGARCGTSPQNSVTNSFGQVWGVDNLSVIDGAVFPSNAHKNPTLTILAFAWRASDHLLNKSKNNG